MKYRHYTAGIDTRGLIDAVKETRRVLVGAAMTGYPTAKHKRSVVGQEGVRIAIRSGSHIEPIHQAVATELYNDTRVDREAIVFERSVPHGYGSKKVDVTLDLTKDGQKGPLLLIGVKSQISSFGKNRANQFDSVRADATNFHESNGDHVVGAVQLISLRELDGDTTFREKKACWGKQYPQLGDYLTNWCKTGGRESGTGKDQHFERVGLLIVDFAPDVPKIYTKISELIADEYLVAGDEVVADLSLDGMLFDRFAEDLVNVYCARLGGARRALREPTNSVDGLEDAVAGNLTLFAT